MTAASHRRVRQLRLRAPSPEVATHTAIMLEDALRVASLSWADSGRLMLVRRLDLGPVSAGASSMSLALQLERRCREISFEPVTQPGPNLQSALAVSFTSSAEAVTLLASQLGRGQALAEWYWPLAVPGWRPERSRRDAWRILMQVAFAQEGAPLVFADVVATAASAGCLGELASAISDQDAAEWCRLCGWPIESALEHPPSSTIDSKVESVGLEQRSLVDLESAQFVERALVGVTASPRIQLCLATALLLHRNPAWTVLTDFPRQLHEVLQSPRRTVAGPSTAKFPGVVDEFGSEAGNRRAQSGREGARHEPNLAPSQQDPAEPASRRSIQEVAATAPSPGSEISDELRVTVAKLSSDEETQVGGLLFLVSVLNRLGFARWLNDRPDLVAADFARRLLMKFGERVGMAADDPLARALESEEETDVTSDHLDWIRQVRRWCRLEARIGLATLIRRPARIRTSRTHLELAFNLAQLDLRIRRQGLDIDPGWVPWLGRVVRFHYLDRDDFPRDEL